MMAIKPCNIFLHCCFMLLVAVSFVSLLSAFPIPGNADEGIQTPAVDIPKENFLKISGRDRIVRRLLIGSTAPICTYNECRGCKTRCSSEQVPVNANDPMNSAYHYRCVCHRRNNTYFSR